MNSLAELDRRYRSNFFLNPDVAYETEYASGYGFLSSGKIFEGRAIDLAASICEGVVRELGVAPLDVWLGEGLDRSEKPVYACLVRFEGDVYQMGTVAQGAYMNAFGLPYSNPVLVELGDVRYGRVFSFLDADWLEADEFGWPLGYSSDDIEEAIEPREDVLETLRQKVEVTEPYGSVVEEAVAAIPASARDGFAIMPSDEDIIPSSQDIPLWLKPEGEEKKQTFGGITMFDRVKNFLTQPFVILGIAALFAVCAFALPEFWDFVFGGSVLLISRSFVNVALLVAGVWVVRYARALIKDGGQNGEVMELGPAVYISVALVILGANIGLS